MCVYGCVCMKDGFIAGYVGWSIFIKLRLNLHIYSGDGCHNALMAAQASH